MPNLSNVTYTANGATTTFVVPFSYIEEADITVTVDDIVVTGYTFNGSGDVVFAVAPLDTLIVYISRDSDVTQRVTTYSDGSELTEADLNNGGDQSIYLHQETRDLITTINADNASVIGRVAANEVSVVELEANQDDLVTLSGVAENATDLGTFTGDIITDTSTIKVALQELETEILNPDIATASFTPAAAPSYAEGKLFYDNSSKSLSYYNDEAEIKMDIGQELWVKVRNNTGVTITNGQVVYISGSVGQISTIALADADAVATSQVIGVATHDIENASNGYVTTFGLVNGLDTSAYTEGDSLYLSSTAGALTITPPVYPKEVIHVCTVTSSHPSTGQILVKSHTEVDVIIAALVAADIVLQSNIDAKVSADGLVTTHSDVTDAGSGIIISAAERTKLDGITAGSNVAKVGTPVDNQIGVWTGDGTIEGEANFTYDSTLDHLELTGEFDIIHTAVTTDEHALEIIVDADGNGDVKAIDIDYITGAIASGSDEAIILVNIDESAATGGDITALEVLSTEGGADNVNAMLVGAGVNPVEQLSGTFSDMDSALVNATDRLAEFISDASDIEMFTSDNDTVTIGNANKFEELEFLLSTVSSRNINPTFEYSTGSGTWASFTPVDGTNGMLNNGVIAWLDGDIPSWAVGVGSEYLIRITRTRNGGITAPIESKVQIVEATEYKWDKNGNLEVAGVTLGTSTAVTSILDEDAMGSNSATALATQQSIKAYADTKQSEIITTRGDIIIGNASGVSERFGIGSAGQVLKSDGTDILWGVGGGGAGGINYMTDSNTDAEADVGDWVTYADAAGENPVDGTAGTATTTYARNTVTPMRGDADFKMVKDAANRQGEGASCAFTVDVADKAKRLTCSFDYDASHVGYADDDIRLSVYDVTNSKLIRVNGEDLKGGNGNHIFQFQTSSDSVSYRLIMHVSSTNAAAYDVFFDNIQVGPREVVKGAAMTDWKDYVPVIQGFGTISSNNSKYRRVGDTVELLIDFVTGTVAALEIQVGLPSGLTVNSDLLVGSVGHAFRGAGSANDFTVIATGGDSYINFGVNGQISPQLGSGLYGSGEGLRLFASVPIQGWSSNAVSSEDLGGREIVVEAEGNDGEIITGLTEDIPFKGTVKDTTSSWSNAGNTGSNTTDAFTNPETGSYLVSGMINHEITAGTFIYAYVNGSQVKVLGATQGINDTMFSGVVPLNKGDVLTLRSSVDITLTNNVVSHNISIVKLASPQTQLGTETVAARYTSNSGQSILTTETVINFEDLDYDTHGAMSGTTYTIPVTGLYDIKAMVTTATGATALGRGQIEILVNGTAVIETVRRLNTPVVGFGIAVSDTLDLNVGDTITVRTDSDNNTTLSTLSNENVFSIARIK